MSLVDDGGSSFWWRQNPIVEESSDLDLCGNCGHVRYLHEGIPCSAVCGCDCDGGYPYHEAVFIGSLGWDTLPEDFPKWALVKTPRDEKGNIRWWLTQEEAKAYLDQFDA